MFYWFARQECYKLYKIIIQSKGFMFFLFFNRPSDFLQLPPVNVTCFAFETDAWKQCIDKTITLKKVFRQKLVGFVTLLNRLRLGLLAALDVDVLHECNKTKFSDDGINPTRLFPYRAACDRINLGEVK